MWNRKISTIRQPMSCDFVSKSPHDIWPNGSKWNNFTKLLPPKISWNSLKTHPFPTFQRTFIPPATAGSCNWFNRCDFRWMEGSNRSHNLGQLSEMVMFQFNGGKKGKLKGNTSLALWCHWCFHKIPAVKSSWTESFGIGELAFLGVSTVNTHWLVKRI